MKQTSLHAVHVESGGKMVEFGGWHMPVQYGPILDEARTVRSKAGLFDLGHMGRVRVTGPDRVAFVDRVATCFCGRNMARTSPKTCSDISSLKKYGQYLLML